MTDEDKSYFSTSFSFPRKTTPEQARSVLKAQQVLQALSDSALENLSLLSAEEVLDFLQEVLLACASFFGLEHWDQAFRNPEVTTTGQVTPYKETRLEQRFTGSAVLGLSTKDVADDWETISNPSTGGAPESKKRLFKRTRLPASPQMKRLLTGLLLLVRQMELLYVGRHLVPNQRDSVGSFFQKMITEFVTSGALDPRNLFSEGLTRLLEQESRSRDRKERNDWNARRRLWNKRKQDAKAVSRKVKSTSRVAKEGTKPDLRSG